MYIKMIDKRKGECPYIFQTNGLKRGRYDVTTKVKQSDGSFIEEVEAGSTEVLSNGGVVCTLNILDADHNTLAGKYTGGDAVIATITIEKSGEIKIA